jgi:tetratricopeptide (TPR) repeat protein
MSGDKRSDDSKVGVPNFGATAIQLARNPLSIIALFVALTEAIASATLILPSSLTHDERLPLIYFVVSFPLVVFCVFAWLVARHSGKLFAPGDYQNEAHYAALQTSGFSVPEVKKEGFHSMPPGLIAEAKAPPSDDWAIISVKDESILTPRPNWDLGQYQLAVMRAIHVGDFCKFEEINQAYLANLKTKGSQREDDKAEWAAFIEYTHLDFGKASDLSGLKALEEAHPRNSATIEYLANGYLLYKDYGQAAAAYERAAGAADRNVEKLRLIGRAARAHAEAGSREVALRMINKIKGSVAPETDQELVLLHAIRNVAELLNQDIAEIAAMGRILEIRPDDIDMRFALAYKHAKLGHNDVALLHYLKIPPEMRNETTWNNIGVAFDNFGLAAKSVQAYRKSETMDETLAMSNLAEKLIKAGFLPEAQQECDRALAIKNHHVNVSYSLAKIKSLPDEEEQKETKILATAKLKCEFYGLIGKAIGEVEPDELGEIWQAPDCPLSAELVDGTFKAHGSYERPQGALSNALLGIAGVETSYRMVVDYDCKIQGRAMYGYVTRRREDQFPATPFGTPDKSEVLMILSEEGEIIQVMEKVASGNTLSSGIVSFYSIVHRRAT